MRHLLLFSFLLIFAGCASKPSMPDSKDQVSEESNIDLEGLMKWLGLVRDINELGYKEKSFNTCEAGYGYSRAHNCRRQHLVVIHYRLQCRDSRGTISTILTEDDITPLSYRDVKWSLTRYSGVSKTDGRGYGQIVTVTDSSQKKERLKLSNDNDFLYIRAGEIKRIVTPENWCEN